MGEAKRKAAIVAASIEKFPNSFQEIIFPGARLDPHYDVSALTQPNRLMGYVLADDLEISDLADCGQYDIDFFHHAAARGITLLDIATTWATSLVRDLDSAEDEERDGSKIYGYERDFLVASLTGKVECYGRFDDEIARYLNDRELDFAWREVEAISEGTVDDESYGHRIRRLLDSHEAGVQVTDLALGVETHLS